MPIDCPHFSGNQPFEIMNAASSQSTRPAKLLAVAAVAFLACGFVGTMRGAEPAFDGGKRTGLTSQPSPKGMCVKLSVSSASGSIFLDGRGGE